MTVQRWVIFTFLFLALITSIPARKEEKKIKILKDKPRERGIGRNSDVKKKKGGNLASKGARDKIKGRVKKNNSERRKQDFKKGKTHGSKEGQKRKLGSKTGLRRKPKLPKSQVICQNGKCKKLKKEQKKQIKCDKKNKNCRKLNLNKNKTGRKDPKVRKQERPTRCQDIECLNNLVLVLKIKKDQVKNFLKQRKRMVSRLGIIEKKFEKSNKSLAPLSSLMDALGGSNTVKSNSPICSASYNSSTALKASQS